jgi:hypothetical protein
VNKGGPGRGLPGRFLVLVLAALPGCGGAAAPPRVQDSPYYPLEVGLTWRYRGGDEPRTIRVVRHEVLDGTPCALVETRRGRDVVATEHVFARADGVFGLTNNGKRLSRPLPILKLPPTPGETWDIRFKIGGHDRQGTYRIGKAEPVEVPLGKFEAVPLQGQILEGGIRQVAFTSWFARGTGMVKQVIRTREQTLTYELEKVERPP